MSICRWPKVGRRNALDEFRLLAVRAAVDVQPSVETAVFRAAQVVGLDDERVAVPVSDRVAVPPRLRLTLRRKLAAIEIDVTDAVVGLVLDQDQLRRLDDLARLRLLMELQESHRHAVGVRIVLRLVHFESLLPISAAQVCTAVRPGCCRRPRRTSRPEDLWDRTGRRRSAARADTPPRPPPNAAFVSPVRRRPRPACLRRRRCGSVRGRVRRAPAPLTLASAAPGRSGRPAVGAHPRA